MMMTSDTAPDSHAPRVFTPGSELKKYLEAKVPGLGNKHVFSLNEVLAYLGEVISRQKLFDVRNPPIVLCDHDLERALHQKALHITELREAVCKQLRPLSAAAHAAVAAAAVAVTLPEAGAGGGGGGGGQKVSNGIVRSVGGLNGSLHNTLIPHNVSNGTHLSAMTPQTVSNGPIICGSKPTMTLTPAGNRSMIIPSSVPASSTTPSNPLITLSTSHPPTFPSLEMASLVQSPRPVSLNLATSASAALVKTVSLCQPMTSSTPQLTRSASFSGITSDSADVEEMLFQVKPALLKVLHKVPGVDLRQTEFTYEEVTRHLSNYILSNKSRFFDDRNIKVAIVANDDLGVAFNVAAFHRSQVTTLLRNQIVPCGKRTVRLPTDRSDGPGSSGSSSGYDSPIGSVSSTSSFELDKDAIMATSSSTVYKIIPTLVPTTNSGALCDSLTNGSDGGRAGVSAVSATEANAASKGKRSVSVSEISAEDETSASDAERPSDKAKAKAVAKAKAKRRNSNRSFEHTDDEYTPEASRKRPRRGSSVIVVEVSREDDEETIYSEQGYETVDICKLDDLEEEEDDDDDDDDVIEDYTEYEIDSEADYKPHIDGEDSEASFEDSDVQDVIIVASAVMLNAGNDDSGSWADSESDFELSNFDVEMGPAAAEVWRCAECREPNTPRMRYCSRCWKERRGWVPERSHPRRKRKKNKRTKGLDTKKSSASSSSVSLDEPEAAAATAIKAGTSTETDSGFSQSMDSQEQEEDEEMRPKVPLIHRQLSSGSAASSSSAAADLMCNFCLTRDKDAGIVHGRLTHQICCYPCAKKLHKKRQPCPLCRRKIEKITRIVKC